MEQEVRQRAGAAAGAEDKTADQGKPCPMSGKYGQCPVSGFLSSKPQAADDASNPFASGSAKLTSSSATAGGCSSDKDSLLWLLCPLHWDRNTMYLLAIVYLFGLINGLVLSKWLPGV